MGIEIEERRAIAANETKGARYFPMRYLSTGFHSLGVRNFRLFIIGQIISLVGTWMQTTAQAWLVLQLTSSPFALGLVTTLQFLPVMAFALYGGVLADRLPKRKTLIVTQTLFLIQAAIFGILVGTNTIQLWHLYILAAVQGIIQAVDTPVRQAFVVEMVGHDEVVNAVSLNSMTFNGARIIGPALAGLVISQIGIAPTLYLNALSYIAVLVALFMMRESELFKVKTIPAGSAWKRLKEGLAYTWKTPKLLALVIVLAAIGTFGYNFTIVLPLLSDFVVHTNAAGFGLLSSVFGLGSLIAALVTAYVKRPKLRRVFIAAAAFSVMLAVLAITSSFLLAALFLAILGVASIVFSIGTNTLMQLFTPDELRGRVMSLNVLLVLGSTPIGALVIGALSDSLGVSVAIVACALLCLVGTGIGWLYWRQHSASGEEVVVSAG